jgi:hypothetical protein
MKNLLFLFIAVSFMSRGQEVKKALIKVKETSATKQYTYTDGTTKTRGLGYNYTWNYVGETESFSAGKKGKILAPILSQYEPSEKLYKKAKLVWTFGMPAGYVLAGGGLVMGVLGLRGDEPNLGLTIGGFSTALIGCGTIGLSLYGGKKLFKKSISKYNGRVKKELRELEQLNPTTGSLIKKWDIQLASNSHYVAPGLLVRLSF